MNHTELNDEHRENYCTTDDLALNESHRGALVKIARDNGTETYSDWLERRGTADTDQEFQQWLNASALGYTKIHA